MDPLCCWCYGNSSNTQKLHEKYKYILDFQLLPAGMWADTNARKQSKQMAGLYQKARSVSAAGDRGRIW